MWKESSFGFPGWLGISLHVELEKPPGVFHTLSHKRDSLPRRCTCKALAFVGEGATSASSRSSKARLAKEKLVDLQIKYCNKTFAKTLHEAVYLIL